jgi:hypothetical protein
MARPEVTEDLLCGPALGSPLADALQAAANLNSPSLLNAVFGRFQAPQESLCQVRSFGFGKGERLLGELCGSRGHAKSIAFGTPLVKNADRASESPIAEAVRAWRPRKVPVVLSRILPRSRRRASSSAALGAAVPPPGPAPEANRFSTTCDCYDDCTLNFLVFGAHCEDTRTPYV